jgi:two-component system phosphate regulon response regulator OmpR
VLDVMLPDGSGLDVCRDLRGQRSNVPIILLTALKEDVDRIIGLEIGADDYLGKPFNPRELIARIKAVLRRHGEAAPQTAEKKTYRFEGFTADPQTRRVIDPEGIDVVLTGAEFDLLKTFLDRPGRVLSRDQLLDLTRGRMGDVFDRSIDVLISRLRRKLGDRATSPLFKTVRNGGYQFAARVDFQDT